jgi:hypothetical protein
LCGAAACLNGLTFSGCHAEPAGRCLWRRDEPMRARENREEHGGGGGKRKAAGANTNMYSLGDCHQQPSVIRGRSAKIYTDGGEFRRPMRGTQTITTKRERAKFFSQPSVVSEFSNGVRFGGISYPRVAIR